MCAVIDNFVKQRNLTFGLWHCPSLMFVIMVMMMVMMIMIMTLIMFNSTSNETSDWNSISDWVLSPYLIDHLHIWCFSCSFEIRNLYSNINFTRWNDNSLNNLIFLLQSLASQVVTLLLVLEVPTFRCIAIKAVVMMMMMVVGIMIIF